MPAGHGGHGVRASDGQVSARAGACKGSSHPLLGGPRTCTATVEITVAVP